MEKGGACLNEELAGAEDEPGVGIADSSGEHTEGPGVASMGVRSEEDFSRPAVAFLGKSDVADALVARIGFEVGFVCYIVKVLDAVLARDIPVQEYRPTCRRRSLA